MGDGSLKNIEDVAVGDNVLAFRHPTVIDESVEGWKNWTTDNLDGSSQVVTNVKSHVGNSYFKWQKIMLSDGSYIDCTWEHVFFVKDNGVWGWKQALTMAPGHSMLKQDGSEVTIMSNVITYTPVTTFNIDVEQDDTYYANGLVTHNAFSFGGAGDKMIF
jgi:hypothetical protein